MLTQRRVLGCLAFVGLCACDARQAAAPPAPVAPSAGSSPSAVADLAGVLGPIRDGSGLPALAAAVLAGDTVIARGAVGVRKAGDPTKVTTSDEWHLGSDTKAMTATLVGLFVDDGKISFSTTLAQAFPAWASSMDPGYRAVTLEMLLAHEGGAPADIPKDIWSEMWKPGDSRAQRLAAVKAMLARPPETPPGTKFVYANAGFMMAGAALEQLSGVSWEDLMRTRIFGPLGMTSCGFGAPATPPASVDQPWGHEVENGRPVPVPPGPQADNPPSLGPAGTVHCSLDDWLKFLAMHLHGARGESRFLAPATFAKLHTPWPGSDYGGGWIITSRDWAGGTALTHSGSNTMFFATVWLVPALDRVFVVATNRADDVAEKAVDSTFGPLIDAYSK